MDAESHKVVDILPNRFENDLIKYFSQFPSKTDVKYFVCDMNPHFDWLISVEAMDLPEFSDCTKAYRNWFHEILNSMDVPWSNGFIEGCNNKTKVLKRVCFGMRNFSNFRRRILFCHT